jgi:hypothetical protein
VQTPEGRVILPILGDAVMEMTVVEGSVRIATMCVGYRCASQATEN